MRVFVFIALAAVLWGCGKANDSAVTVDYSRKHQSNWESLHGKEFLKADSNCKDCHGATLDGGISGVSCTKCHAKPHGAPYKEHYKETNLLSACSACHGAGLTGGINAPACSTCHLSLSAGTAPVQGECVSCHGQTPDGALFPNRSGAHKTHLALSGVACSACHNNAGYGTANHGSRLTVAFLAVYNAKAGAAIRNSDGSCANVSCHGGIITRAWYGDRVDPLTDCDQCHQSGTAQYNSYYTGQHTKHLAEKMQCIDCHDMTASSGGKSHFSDLSTPAFDLAPAATVRTPVTYSAGRCSPGAVPPAGTFSIGVCHSGSRSW